MLRKITAVLLSLAVALACAGCAALPERSRGGQTLHNGYMGLAVTVPDGWFVDSHNTTNLTQTPEESRDYDSLDMTDISDGGKYLPLIALQNRNRDSSSNHIVLQFFAEDYTGVFSTMRDYVDGCEYVYTGDQGNGYYGSLVSRDEVTLNGLKFQKLIVSVNHEDNNLAYIEEYYITRAGSLYLTCYINYWNNPAAKEEAERVLAASFTLASGQATQSLVTTYVNGYFGISVQVDEERYYSSVNEVNMTQTAADSLDLFWLDATTYDDGGVCYDLVSLQCVNTNTFGEHAVMELYVEDYAQLPTVEDYLDMTVDYFVNNDASQGYTRGLAARDTATVNSQHYSRLVFVVELDSGERYTEEYYVCELRGMYFIAYVQYTTGDEDSRADAMEMLEQTFRLGDAQALYDDGLSGLI